MKVLFLCRNEANYTCQVRYFWRQAFARLPDVELLPWGEGYPGWDPARGLDEIVLQEWGTFPDAFVEWDDAPQYGHPNKIPGLDLFPCRKVYQMDTYWTGPHVRWDYCNRNGFTDVISPYLQPVEQQQNHFQAKMTWIPYGANADLFRDRVPWQVRSWEVGLLGALGTFYPARSAAHSFLSGQDDFSYFYRPHPGYSRGEVFNPGSIHGEEYAAALSDLKVFITCGNKNHVPHAKYFEALAAGCCLLATEPYPLDFLPRDCYARLEEPVDPGRLMGTLHHLIKDGAGEAIAKRGKAWVQSCGLLEHRAKELYNLLCGKPNQ